MIISFLDEDGIDLEEGHASFISAYVTPGPKQRDISEQKKVSLVI